MTASDTRPPKPPHHVDALPVGTRLGEFEIRALLGVGGFAMVYAAFDHSLHRTVAIKEYIPSALAGRVFGRKVSVRSPIDEPAFQAGLQSFVAEARMLAQFDHPSLVKAFRFWQDNNTAYMVMPLYKGMTLRQARARMKQPPSEAWLRKVLWSVLDALRTLHQAQTLHRDISPDNIFLQDLGPPVLLDLGAARHAINDQDRRHTAVLKVSFAPIEQYASDLGSEGDLHPGPWSDLYSLAAVVHACLCNDDPPPATLRLVRDTLPAFDDVARTVQSEFGVHYTPPFVRALEQTLQVQPAQRPQTIHDFIALMELQPPAGGMAAFDWRAEWVSAQDIVARSRSRPAQARGASQQQASDAQVTQVMDWDDDAPAPHHASASAAREAKPTGGRKADRPAETGPASLRTGARASAHDPARAGRHARTANRWVAPLAGLVVAALAIGAFWMALPRPSTPKPAARSAELAAGAAPSAAPAAAVASVAPSAAAPAVAPASAAPAPEPAAPVAAPAPANSTLESVPGSTAGMAETRPSLPAHKAPKPGRRTVSDAPALPEVAAAPAPAPAPEPPPPVFVPAPRPAPQRSPVDACADASFIARPMCIHRECQKPAFARHPVCVDNAQRRHAEEQRRREVAQ